jgi:hypothetical protein
MIIVLFQMNLFWSDYSIPLDLLEFLLIYNLKFKFVNI